MNDTHDEFGYDSVFGNTEPPKNPLTLYVVLESDSNVFHGVYDTLKKAAAKANQYPGANLFKCDLNGEWQALDTKPSVFVIKETLTNPKYDRRDPTKNPQYLPSKILNRLPTLEAAREWMRAYCARTWVNLHDRISVDYDNSNGCKLNVYTSQVQNPGTPNEHLLGGFYLGTVVTDVETWEYVDCENATTTNS